MESDTVTSARSKITKAQNLVNSLTQSLAICAAKKRAHLLVERADALVRLETAQKHLDDVVRVEAECATKLAAIKAEQQRLSQERLAKAAAIKAATKTRSRKMRSPERLTVFDPMYHHLGLGDRELDLFGERLFSGGHLYWSTSTW